MKTTIYVLMAILFASCASSYVTQSNIDESWKTVRRSDSLNCGPEAREYFNIALEHAQDKQMSSVISNLSKAIEAYPEFASAYYLRGVSKIMLNDTNGGITDLQKAGELGVLEAYNVLRKINNRMVLQQMIINN